jgi:hypothetical protein
MNKKMKTDERRMNLVRVQRERERAERERFE